LDHRVLKVNLVLLGRLGLLEQQGLKVLKGSPVQSGRPELRALKVLKGSLGRSGRLELRGLRALKVLEGSLGRSERPEQPEQPDYRDLRGSRAPLVRPELQARRERLVLRVPKESLGPLGPPARLELQGRLALRDQRGRQV